MLIRIGNRIKYIIHKQGRTVAGRACNGTTMLIHLNVMCGWFSLIYEINVIGTLTYDGLSK